MKFLNYFPVLCSKTLSYSVKVQCMKLHNNCVLKHNLYRTNSLNFLNIKHLSCEHFRRIHFSGVMYAKSFRDTENEYAHEILQSIPAYTKSIVQQPFSVNEKEFLEGNKELSEFAKSTSTAENCLVFVYGTLKVDEPNYDQMTNPSFGRASYVGGGRTVQKWPLIIASRFNIPFLLYREGVGKNIIGDIFVVDKSMLSHMDAFECHPTYYTRIQVEVEVLKKETADTFHLPMIVRPWVYFLMKFRASLLTLPYLEDYHSKGSHGLEYISRYKRPPGQDYYHDVKIEDTTDTEDIYK